MTRIFPFAILAFFSILYSWEPEPELSAFTLPANQWTKIAEAPVDPFNRELEPGQGAYLCYFPDSSLFYRYGGYTPTENNDLYSFSLSQRKWNTLLTPDYSWPPPQDRPGAGPWWSMAYDSRRKVIWMMCGSGAAAKTHSSLYNDIWKLTPETGTFTKMNSSNFYVGGEVRIVYDSLNDRILRAPAYSGEWTYQENRDRTWCYNPNTNSWEGRNTPNSPKEGLAAVWVYAKDYGKAVYMSRDTAVDSLNCEKALTWTYDYATNTWTKLNSTINPPMRVCAAAASDTENRLVIIHGGVGGVKGEYGYASRGGGVVLRDTWVLDLSKGQWNILDVGRPAIPLFKKSDGTPLLPRSTTTFGRLVFVQAADYDIKNKVFVVSSPQYGVWALRYEPSSSQPAIHLPALPPLPEVSSPERVFPSYPLNQRLLTMVENKWIGLNGGSALAGTEVPYKFDGTTGWMVKFGGCNNAGGTFAGGYGNNLVAFDPATERWIHVRPTDPCGPARPQNGCSRWYEYDPVRKCLWFVGGGAGNILASSIPQDWTGGNGTWRYDSMKDKFELIPTTGGFISDLGVICAFDRANGLFVIPSWGPSPNGVSIMNSGNLTWSKVSNKIYGAGRYLYADFADSIGKLLVMDYDTLRGFDPITAEWSVVSIAPSKAKGHGTTVAYDCYNNVCMVSHIDSQTYIYDIRTGMWTNMMPDSGTPALGEQLAFDRRHGVFIGGHTWGRNLFAYKYKNVSTISDPYAKVSEPITLSSSPNPFNSLCRINISLSFPSHTRLEIMTADGRLLKTIEDRNLSAGKYGYRWNGTDASGNIVSAGLYVFRLSSGGRILINKAAFIK